jgi:beta-barrel assembly-enhancing protease
MKRTMLVIALLATASPAFAQLGGIGGALKKAQASKQAFDDMNITDAEERQIGEEVSAKLRDRFGVVQDPAVHKYVSLIGMTLARASERPNLDWNFIVLDTDGVNAYASPGGLVHITRGALALAKNEAEVAGVLSHEIGHIARKHTVNALKKGKAVQAGSSAAGSRNAFLSEFADRVYQNLFENNFDRGDELDADKVGVLLAKSGGYNAAALADFLAHIEERNKTNDERNGMFASHPQTKERMDKVRQAAANANTAVLVEARYKQNVKYTPSDMSKLATVAPTAAAPKEEKKEEPKKGFGLGGLKQTVAPEKQSAQVSASGGARGVTSDRDAKGGPNKGLVKVAVSGAELETFKKGIA